MKTYHCLLIFALATLITACNPVLTRRYKSATWDEVVGKPIVDVKAFSVDQPQDNAKAALLTLTDRGQSELIRALSENSKTATDLLEVLGAEVGKKSQPGRQIDKTIFKRRIVLTAERTNQVPGDRIQWLRCTISGLSHHTIFKSWDKFSTKHETIDLGKLTLAQSVSGELSVNATSAESSTDPVARGGKFAASRNLTEEVSLRQRYVVLTGLLADRKAIVVQEGVVGIDLAGNAFIDIVFDVPNSKPEPMIAFESLQKDGKWVDQDKIAVNRYFIEFADASSDITGNLRCEYLVRTVDEFNGRRTVVEGDDVVVYKLGKTTAQCNIPLIPKTEVLRRVWYIADNDNQALHIEYPPDATVVQFSTYDAAESFLFWLREKGSVQTDVVKIGNKALAIGGDPLKKSDISRLSIRF